MKAIIRTIAKDYQSLRTSCPERVKAFGVIYNNCSVGGVRLNQHPAGKRVTGQVLNELGYGSTVVDVKGNLDDFL